VLRYIDGLPIAEIATQLGRTPAAVAGFLKRGLVQFRELMPDQEETPNTS
jgi:DNA-directed RNA polymerase specialized sigma24 family protein